MSSLGIAWDVDSSRSSAAPPDVRTVQELVEAVVSAGTGGRAVAMAADALASPLARLWADAMEAGSELTWLRLPDRALEAIERSPNGVTAADLTFLVDLADGVSVGAVAAVRLLGSIGEDGYVPMPRVRAVLLDLLKHRDPAVRIAVAEALWQMADRPAVSALRQALDSEAHPAVRATLEHVLRVLA
jgi:hypothetical protein